MTGEGTPDFRSRLAPCTLRMHACRALQYAVP